MKVLLLLWVALVLSVCCGNVRCYDEDEEGEETSPYFYDDSSVTPTPDYDYNSTFDYYLVTGVYFEREGRSGGCSSRNQQTLMVSTLMMALSAQRLIDF